LGSPFAFGAVVSQVAMIKRALTEQ